MIRGKKTNKFNTEKNKPMRSLRNTLLYCVHGKPMLLATENGAEITAEKKANEYEVVLVSTKKTPRGYAKIVLTYDLKSKLLTKMRMDEYNGNSTLYEMNNLKTNGNIDAKVFDIPEKK
jgi:outer membrane lipoprotein-sorting protein